MFHRTQADFKVLHWDASKILEKYQHQYENLSMPISPVSDVAS